jgi:hypothetical protein
MSLKRNAAVLTLMLASLTSARLAVAAEGDDVCTDSYEQSQRLMQPGQGESKLLVAREKLRTCMRSNCKDWLVADCSKWLADVEARIPTVVFSARTSAGRDLVDVSVTTSAGATLAPRLDGRAVEVEPGEQVFVFVGGDGVRREQRVLVREGERLQRVTATFDAPADSPQPQPQPEPRSSSGEDRSAPSSLKYVGYAAAGAGVIGLGLGAIFGMRAISERNDNCTEATLSCRPGALDSARSAATVSTIGFVAGGVLLATGIVLVVAAPSSSSSLRVNASASLAPGRGGLVLGGAW